MSYSSNNNLQSNQDIDYKNINYDNTSNNSTFFNQNLIINNYDISNDTLKPKRNIKKIL